MKPDAAEAVSRGPQILAASLAPVLQEACENRLGEIQWFKADWQRGGAATGTSTFRRDDIDVTVVVKLPVVQRELSWLRRLQRPEDPQPVVPRLFASGEMLGGYDLAWVVIEFLPHGPLGLRWHDDHIARIAEAAARFHQLAREHAVDQPPQREDWPQLLQIALDSVKLNPIAEQQRWAKAIKRLRRNVEAVVDEWEARPLKEWLHGDLHIANAMSRVAMDSGEVCLIDLAEVHPGHWVEDAVYLERQLWARPERMQPLKPVKAIANARKRLGLPVEGEYPRLAMIRRALLAASAPKFIRSEGHPRHLEACLYWLETALNELT